jgi:hypothetical protein
MKKTTIFIVTLVLLILAFSLPATAASTFTDVDGHWAASYINYWTGKDVLHGYPNETFQPDAYISRAEVAQVLYLFLGLYPSTDNPYNDIYTNDWYFEAVCTCTAWGIDKGYDDDSFRPSTPITREEAMSMLAHAVSSAPADNGIEIFSDAEETGTAYVTAINALIRDSHVDGYPDGTLRPQRNITRGEFAKILYEITQPTGANCQVFVRIEDTLGKYLEDSTSEYITENTLLTPEVLMIISRNYNNMRITFPSDDMQQVMDQGIKAYIDSEADWEIYVDEYYSSVGGAGDAKTLLKSLDSIVGDMIVGLKYKLTFVDTQANRLGVVYTVTIWRGATQ